MGSPPDPDGDAPGLRESHAWQRLAHSWRKVCHAETREPSAAPVPGRPSPGRSPSCHRHSAPALLVTLGGGHRPVHEGVHQCPSPPPAVATQHLQTSLNVPRGPLSQLRSPLVSVRAPSGRLQLRPVSAHWGLNWGPRSSSGACATGAEGGAGPTREMPPLAPSCPHGEQAVPEPHQGSRWHSDPATNPNDESKEGRSRPPPTNVHKVTQKRRATAAPSPPVPPPQGRSPRLPALISQPIFCSRRAPVSCGPPGPSQSASGPEALPAHICDANGSGTESPPPRSCHQPDTAGPGLRRRPLGGAKLGRLHGAGPPLAGARRPGGAAVPWRWRLVPSGQRLCPRTSLS